MPSLRLSINVEKDLLSAIVFQHEGSPSPTQGRTEYSPIF